MGRNQNQKVGSKRGEHLLAVTDGGLCYRKKADDGVYIFSNGKETRGADGLEVVQMAEVDGGILYIAVGENSKMMWGTMRHKRASDGNS